jgi:uncharacterized lipoprotein YajG
MVAKVLILAALLLAGCQTSGGTFCDIARPVRLSEQTIAVMTDAEVDAAVAHNRKGQKLCDWKK